MSLFDQIQGVGGGNSGAFNSASANETNNFTDNSSLGVQDGIGISTSGNVSVLDGGAIDGVFNFFNDAISFLSNTQQANLEAFETLSAQGENQSNNILNGSARVLSASTDLSKGGDERVIQAGLIVVGVLGFLFLIKKK